MRANEVIRIIAFSILGSALMFWAQPLIYTSRLIGLTDVPRIEVWVSNSYMTGATIVFVVSVISVVLWYWMAARAQVRVGKDVQQWSIVWWIILLFPILSICAAINFFRGSDRALPSLTSLFILDVLFLYWFTTATSSPGSLNFVPPGAFLMRRLFRN